MDNINIATNAVDNAANVNTGLQNVKRNNRWSRVNVGEPYFVINEYGCHEQGEDRDVNDQHFYRLANYFSDEQLAHNIHRAQTIWREILRWQAENDDAVDWNNESQEKWFFYFDHLANSIRCSSIFSMHEIFTVYFTSKEKIEKCISVFGDDIIWLVKDFYSTIN